MPSASSQSAICCIWICRGLTARDGSSLQEITLLHRSNQLSTVFNCISRVDTSALSILQRLQTAGSDLKTKHGIRPQFRVGIDTGLAVVGQRERTITQTVSNSI